MKKELQPKSEEIIKRDYPITTDADGWFFQIQEVSNGCYEINGTDLFGREVKRKGINPDELLDQCSLDAIQINKQK